MAGFIVASKKIEELRVADLEAHHVWQYTDSDRADETAVRPVARVPVGSLTGKLIGTQVMLANGSQVWALIGNVDQTNARLTQHFLALSVERNGSWFNLARYHDFDYETHGPSALAEFLSLSIDEVFPIRYDIRAYAKGKTEALVGFVRSEPLERLSREEIIAMAVP